MGACLAGEQLMYDPYQATIALFRYFAALFRTDAIAPTTSTAITAPTEHPVKTSMSVNDSGGLP